MPGPRTSKSAFEWRYYGGDQGASRYAPLSQIDRSNVKDLKVAWVHRTGDSTDRPATTIECTPIVVDGVMYLTTARLQIRALNAKTGEVIWNFNPFEASRSRSNPGVNRAVCYWESGDDKRIFVPIRDRLLCLNAKTGKPVTSFGDEGSIDLKENFDHDMTGLSFKHTSPVVAYKDLIITGGGGGEGPYPEAPGHIRGYDARTGKRRWIFHTVPKPGQFGNDTWKNDSWKHAGGTNNWAGMSLDEQRGIVFASIGSPSFDFYGGDRKGANLFGNCVLALDANTGKRIWHFQTIHHDVWDYDLPAQPALITITDRGRKIEAVAQVTKMGFVYFFDRITGKPLFPVEERPISKSDVPGEELWPTQPYPLKPPPLNRQAFTEDQITDISPEAHAYVRKIWESTRAGNMFTPPSLQGTVIHPGFRGGALWGGCSYDPAKNRLFVNSDENSDVVRLEKAKETDPFDYALPVRRRLVDQDGYPGIKPPWSYLTAIDCVKGEFVWRVVLGEFDELKARGIPKTGTTTNGGSIATASGLVFIAATRDERMRAFDGDNGEILWEHKLNAGGYATPCTYEADGKQYVVIAAGGGKGMTKSGDEIVAFSL
ncbi:MAG: pyrroloquinoline quinone-dependent dehydrogenase [Bryobacteraceae bacterium]